MIGFSLETREHTPLWLNVTLPLLAVGATLVLCSGLILLAGANVFVAYSKLFLSALSTRFNLVETAVKATPLIFTGLAVVVAFRARFWNIGAEGQLLAGAMAAAFVGARASLPAWSLCPSMILAGMAAGALWAMIPAVLKSHLKVDDVVSSLLFAFIDALQLRLQASAIHLPYQVFLMMPFVLTIVGMALVSRNAKAPAALLVPFRKEER